MANFDVSAVLDAAQNRLGVKSDYMLCKVTGLKATAVSSYRVGRSLPDEKACKILADAAKIDADILMIQVQAARAKDDGAAALWSRIAYRLERAAAGAVPAIFAAVIASQFVADEADAISLSALLMPHVQALNCLYIVSSICAVVIGHKIWPSWPGAWVSKWFV